MSDDDPTVKVLGQTPDASLTISLDQLGAPGIFGSLEIVPFFTNSAGDAPAPRAPVAARHAFEVKARLSRSPATLDLQGAFGPDDGGSYLTVPGNVHELEVAGTYGLMRFFKNASNELSMVSASINAVNADDAHSAFMVMLSAFIDRVSLTGAVPIFIELIVVRDTTTEVQSMYFVSPPRPTVIGNGAETLHLELAPVYALYREAQNSSSPYYRVLCLFKIMEGLLGSLRTELRKRAKHAGKELVTPKALVPEHADFPKGLRSYVGKPIKDLFDNFLQKQFRDAMAHFNLKGRNPLNVSDQTHWKRFIEVAFVADLCARVLINQHEQMLTILKTTATLPGSPER
ncbi:MAG TPA: methylamine utilization protein MauJ [Allosphingosinicella sp.]|nr:methylamine utilization protein MauJ [Allosphingosinicella sp.]